MRKGQAGTELGKASERGNRKRAGSLDRTTSRWVVVTLSAVTGVYTALVVVGSLLGPEWSAKAEEVEAAGRALSAERNLWRLAARHLLRKQKTPACGLSSCRPLSARGTTSAECWVQSGYGLGRDQKAKGVYSR